MVFRYAVTTSKASISYNSNIYALSRPYPWDAEFLMKTSSIKISCMEVLVYDFKNI